MKHLALNNQAFVKFVLIVVDLTHSNKKKLIQTRHLCSSLSILYKHSFCPRICQNLTRAFRTVFKLTKVISKRVDMYLHDRKVTFFADFVVNNSQLSLLIVELHNKQNCVGAFDSSSSALCNLDIFVFLKSITCHL